MNDADRVAAWDAARGWCVACGRTLGSNGVVHHRVAKGMGGRKGARKAGTYADRPPFTVVLHDHCHTLVHAHPVAARAAGLIVSAWGDPARVLTSRLTLTEG